MVTSLDTVRNPLACLGVDTLSERVYRSLLLHPGERAAELARRLDAPEHQVRTCLDGLADLSVVRPYGEPGAGYYPVGPERAMALLLGRRQAELAAHQQRIETARAAAAQLIAECADHYPNSVAGEEVVPPWDTPGLLAELGHRAHREVLVFAPHGTGATADSPAGDQTGDPTADQELLARGVRLRTVHLDSVVHNPPARARLARLSERGAAVRTAPVLPLRMTIFDRRTAVLPSGPGEDRPGTVVLRRPGVLTALCALFEGTWADATPLGRPAAPTAQGLSRQQAQTLELLADGLTDEVIAKQMGVSSRTIRRIVAELLQQLQARSRFEAGLRAVQAGLLPAHP
ncbi:helix-turn-helix transcriptional regulator [Kitasatospora sp. MMS16-BH015]|uniref:helix-turn-helix transcriptional regulator n=1 Tax=Kitasatospora sp. MMS16-BH015 TaxID=2018025 RepID=UPI000CA2A057|nr:helix-turn-helix transcriptional regulator [Kitasatospora sp. MMS16-BH015]AUG78274.1 helix-turn-helix transcriptional regulator [Kitasatospora sp. MMS16-BH015]